jgi:hypothetical protein
MKQEKSFAEGLRTINTRGAQVVKGVRLTKERAQIILSFIERYRLEWYDKHPEGQDLGENEMQLAMTWITNQIYKRWSQNEIYSPSKGRKPSSSFPSQLINKSK